MKTYFLILLGVIDNDEITSEIAVSLSPIVDSPNLKFSQCPGSILLHFASEVSQEEIFDYLLPIIEDKCNSFFLTENTDNLSVYLPSSVKEHLMDLESMTGEIKIELDTKKNDLVDEEILALLLDGIKRTIKKPTLDQILEKISSKGLESLSKYEQEILEDYSKN